MADSHLESLLRAGVDYPPEWYRARGRRTRREQIEHEKAASRRRHIERVDRAPILERDQYLCRYCGASDLLLCVDHVLPFSRGGTSDQSNLAAACRSCNSRKKDRTPEEAGMPLLPIGTRRATESS